MGQVGEQVPARLVGGRQPAGHQVERRCQPVELGAKARLAKPGLVVAVGDPLRGFGGLGHRSRDSLGHKPGHDQGGGQGGGHPHGQGDEYSV